jgi:hypothetical protein
MGIGILVSIIQSNKKLYYYIYYSSYSFSNSNTIWLGRYEEDEDACARGAAGVTIGFQGIVTLQDTVHELGIDTKRVARGGTTHSLHLDATIMCARWMMLGGVSVD